MLNPTERQGRRGGRLVARLAVAQHEAVRPLLGGGHGLLDPAQGLLPGEQGPKAALRRSLVRIGPTLRARVRPAEAERGHAHDLIPGHGRAQLRVKDHRVSVDVQVGIQRSQVRIRRHQGSVEHQDDLDQPAYTGIGLLVAHMRLGRDMCDRRVLAVVHHHPAHGADLDGVTEGSAGAMALAEEHILRSEARLAQALPDALLLRGPVRRREARTPAILIRTCPEHHRQRPRSQLLLRVAFGLHVNTAATFPADEAVGTGVESEAAAAVGEHSRPALADPPGGRHHDEDAHAERLVQGRRLLCDERLLSPFAVRPCPHPMTSGVRRHKRCGACRVHAEVRAGESEGVRKPVHGDDVAHLFGIISAQLHGDLVPLTPRITHEGADALPVERVPPPTGLVQATVADFQHPTLAWRHGPSLLLA
mmetsp:Transcript_27377/g.79361  ORF Transcript_27377/g.79361 Transcript_27377/m.79361 type:complete len:420 (-) Transcript_27377:1097-2356(-)